MNKKILKMVEEYEEDNDFFGPVDESEIKRVEEVLKITLPNQYREFIMRYGSGGICGVVVEGIEGALGSSMMQTTERYRNLGLEKDNIVIFDASEYVMCMCIANNNSKVYTWYRGEKVLHECYGTFDEFLEDYFQEGIDNL